jgi:hypothetical protein
MSALIGDLITSEIKKDAVSDLGGSGGQEQGQGQGQGFMAQLLPPPQATPAPGAQQPEPIDFQKLFAQFLGSGYGR